ncbi:unnamed protein product [Pieris macdunnoughi]|uniref:Cathepsin propeptide inhibitor domain-containing protein n=1 Tax=Pieris macdunnoughi TaxID=345717 RepID=A0A821T4F1_9NEOP|nr:unnamed protein product [Pieris macdunnoughi]
MKYTICFLLTLFITTICYEYDDDNEEFDVFYEELEREEQSKKPIIYDLKDAKNLFGKYLKDFNKSYNDAKEYKEHFKNFVDNLKYINEVNSSGKSSIAGLNSLSDSNAEQEVEGFQ